MPEQVKASLVAEEEDIQTRSDIEAYQGREVARRRRAAVIRVVKEDIQSRRRLPDVSEPTRYEMGEEGQIPAIVEPLLFRMIDDAVAAIYERIKALTGVDELPRYTPPEQQRGDGE